MSTQRPVSTTARQPENGPPRRGVVAVVVRDRRFLVIRRSQFVSAPGMLCFPGGGIEPGEAESAAVVREMLEELACPVLPLRRVWSSVTRWNVELAWWHVEPHGRCAELGPRATASLALNTAEVSEVHWLDADELSARPDLLDSNHEFLAAWRRGAFELGSPG